MAENDDKELPEQPKEEYAAIGFRRTTLCDYRRVARQVVEGRLCNADRALRCRNPRCRQAASPRHAPSYSFTLLVLAVGVLYWMKVIASETAGTLLGAVVGAIFNGRRSN